MLTLFLSSFVVDKYRDGPAPFVFKEDENCGYDWKKWLRGFEIYARANTIEEATDKLNWMLHYAGSKVQSIYDVLPEIEQKEIQAGPYLSGYVFPRNEYNDAIEKLNKFFEPKQNESYERHIFREIRQKKEERFDMFLVRLREQADRCNFGEQLDSNIREQITSGCCSDVLRRKILERGDFTLDRIIKMAQIVETVAKQQEKYGKNASQLSSAAVVEEMKNESVCKIENKAKFQQQRKRSIADNFDGFCGRCGSKGHKASDEKCPARGKTCNHCGRKDHFARKCFIRENGNKTAKFIKRKPNTRDEGPPMKMKHEQVQSVESTYSKNVEDDYEDVFCIDSNGKGNQIWCIIGRLDTEVTVDSGSRYNIVDKDSWIEMKQKGIITTHRQTEVDNCCLN